GRPAGRRDTDRPSGESAGGGTGGRRPTARTRTPCIIPLILSLFRICEPDGLTRPLAARGGRRRGDGPAFAHAAPRPGLEPGTNRFTPGGTRTPFGGRRPQAASWEGDRSRKARPPSPGGVTPAGRATGPGGRSPPGRGPPGPGLTTGAVIAPF